MGVARRAMTMNPFSVPRRTEPALPLLTGRVLRGALTAAAIAAAALSPATHARAADITPRAATTVSVDTTGIPAGPTGAPVYWEWQRITMRVGWTVPDGAAPGDTFSVPLDPALNAPSFIPFDLRDEAGAVVATAAVAGGRVVFTLTDYVRTHTGVKGDAFFAVAFNTTSFSTTTPNYVDVYGTRVGVNVDPGPDGLWNYKYGYWQPDETRATARDAGGVLVQRDRAHIRWVVQLKSMVDSPARDWTSLTITDVPSTGSHFNCAQAAGGWPGLRPEVDVVRQGAPTPPQVSVVSCTPGKLVLRVTKTPSDRGVYRVGFDGWLDVDTQGRPVYRDAQNNWHLGFNPEGFGNEAALDYDGWKDTFATVTERTSQGGAATGTGVTPRVDIEKYAGTWGGVKFVNGLPVLDEAGQPASLPLHDHDAAPGLEVSPENATAITMTVTNTGTETLSDVNVADEAGSDPDLSGFTCTFKGSTTMPFQGLAPGETITCTVSLRGAFGNRHRDTATVTARGAGTGTTVSDSDEFYAVYSLGAPIVYMPPATPAQIIVTPQGAPSTTPTSPTVAVSADSPVLVSAPTRGVDISGRPANHPQISVRKRALARVVRVGGRARWQIVVRNTGGGVARRVRVCDTPPAHLVIAGPRTATVRVAGKATRLRVAAVRGASCVTVPRLAPGRTVVWSMRATVTAGARRRVTNTATATAARLPVARAVASPTRVAPSRPRATPAVTG